MKQVRQISTLFLTMVMLTGLLPASTASSAEQELRGVWVATVYQIDYPARATTDAESLKTWADSILDRVQQMGFNAVFLQVRPTADSFYSSDIFPWSKYLSGKQGQAPEGGFDPLAYWVDAAHRRGIALHAWINPYRIATSQTDFDAMVDTHPAKQHPDWVVKYKNGQYYFNPGLPEVRELVTQGVAEIVQNYAVDGVHLDDYFYPGTDFEDSETYQALGGEFQTIGDWRRNNVDTLISGLRDVVHAGGKLFGVSPSGIWANQSDTMPEGSATRGYESYFTSAADTRKWVKNEWIDYIVPQIYWNIGYKIADYQTLVNWWADVVRGTKVALYIGMADYKADSEDVMDVWYGAEEMRRQLALNRTIPEIAGEVHFSYRDIAASSALSELYTEVYGGKEPAPEIEWLTHTAYMEGMNGRFVPEGKLSRAQAAMLFARIMQELGRDAFDKNKTYATSFHDVSADAWYASAVGFMQQYKLIEGYADGTFRPDATITRAEFATMISRLAELQTGGVSFEDVSEAHWAYRYIQNAAARGYISGYDDGSFRPDRTITRAETTKILNRLLGRAPHTDAIDQNPALNVFPDVTKSHWAYYEIVEATYTHEYVMENGAETWNMGDSRFVGENGFVYISDTFTFEVPKLRLTDPLTPLNLNKVDAIALHHMEHVSATFRDVERWHVEDNGWRAIGYNFWIGLDGTVYVGRGFNVGAGVGGHNDHVISVGFQGDYEDGQTSMPDAQYQAGIKLMKWLVGRVPTIDQAGGHGSWNVTDCPGKNFPLEDMVAAAELTLVPKKTA